MQRWKKFLWFSVELALLNGETPMKQCSDLHDRNGSKWIEMHRNTSKSCRTLPHFRFI